MPDTDPCEICRTQCHANSIGDAIRFECPRCGTYVLSGTAISLITKARRAKQAVLSGWVREQNVLGQPPTITSETLAMISKMSPPTLVGRADRLLLGIVRGQSRYGEPVDISLPKYQALAYCVDSDEFTYILRMLKDRGLLQWRLAGAEDCQVTPSGYLAAEDTLKKRATSSQGFVAMWFDPEMREIYERGFASAILAAGYEPLRIDRHEHIGKIDDEIIAQIRRSRFIVADFTGHRGGGYFEAGFAMGLNLPVIYSCRKDNLSALHFDIRQFNTIDWEGPADLAQRLQQRIAAIIGDGPKTPSG